MTQKVIFLADDDRDDSEMFCEALSEIGNDIFCRTAVNGEELLMKLSESDKPHLIFLDLNMPIMDGWESLQHLKNDTRYKDIPVIIISTSSHKEEIDKAIGLGALCYLVKPNSFNELKEILTDLMTGLENDFADTIATLIQNCSKHIYGKAL